jgi:hypothetical protein
MIQARGHSKGPTYLITKRKEKYMDEKERRYVHMEARKESLR